MTLWIYANVSRTCKVVPSKLTVRSFYRLTFSKAPVSKVRSARAVLEVKYKRKRRYAVLNQQGIGMEVISRSVYEATLAEIDSGTIDFEYFPK